MCYFIQRWKLKKWNKQQDLILGPVLRQVRVVVDRTLDSGGQQAVRHATVEAAGRQWRRDRVPLKEAVGQLLGELQPAAYAVVRRQLCGQDGFLHAQDGQRVKGGAVRLQQDGHLVGNPESRGGGMWVSMYLL